MAKAGCIMYVKKLQTWSIKKSTACCHVKKYCLQRAVLLHSKPFSLKEPCGLMPGFILPPHKKLGNLE